MPVLRLSVSEEQHATITEAANKESLTLQDYLRKVLFGTEPVAEKFTPEEAERRALEKFDENSEPFTVPDIYGEEWLDLDPKMTGAFGRRCFNHFKASGLILFKEMSHDGRRATYVIKKEEIQ